MLAFKKTVTVENPDRIVISGLPVRKGQRVEVVVLAREARPARSARALRRLLADTQRVSVLRPVTEKEIAEEIAAYRASR
ncbi:hypothetical protein FBQ97_04640 [Acidobacteria bacterium ACD]|nr:MAG: hypothetical protein EDX89_19615 [Acidobacteriota bacterium]MCE7958128.1 hypothetical protein [Acidobacteria bacterium ACB2]MDL1949087.1 hypothetical protein [Acidobacteria bacterium ACD]